MTEVPELLRRAMELRGVDPDEVAAKAAVLVESGELDAPTPAPVPAATPGEPLAGQMLIEGAAEPREPGLLTYEDFFPPSDVAAYKRVKRGSMQLARVARQVVAELVGGQLTQMDDSRKEYIETPKGLFRMAMSHASDNQTEMREHERLGARVVVMGDQTEMRAFFCDHGLAGNTAEYDMRAEIERRLHR